MNPWVEAGSRAILKTAVRDGMAKKGIRPDLRLIPIDLLLPVATTDYLSEAQAVLSQWAAMAERLELSQAADEIRSAQLIDDIIAHTRSLIQMEETKNARS